MYCKIKGFRGRSDSMKVKRILALTVADCLCSISVYATQINTIIDTGSGMWAEPEKVYSEIDDSVKCWFGLSNKEKGELNFKEKLALENKRNLTFIPTGDSDAAVQVYREERGRAVASDGMVTGLVEKDMSLDREDLRILSKELGADYIFYFRIINSQPTYSVGFFSAGQKVNVITDFRIWDARQEKYVFIKRYQTTGSSKSFYVGIGSTSHAIEKGLHKALEKIEDDKDQIIAVVK